MTADPEGLVVLIEPKTSFEGETIAGALMGQGIRATVADELSSNVFGGVIGPKVMVRRADLERARNALRSIKAESVDIDWSELDVGQQEDPLAGRWSTRRRIAVLVIFGVGALGLLLVFAGANTDSAGARTAGIIVFFAAMAMGFGAAIAPRPAVAPPPAPEDDPSR
jgi:hypothetical protein